MFADIVPHNQVYYKVARTPELFEKLDEYFTIHQKEFDAKENASKKVPVKIIKADDEFIYIPIPYLNYVVSYLFGCGIMTSIDTITPPDLPNFNTTDDWIEKFSAREGQIELWNEICNSRRGVIQTFTGFGKSLFIVACASMYAGPGNILITAPFNSIGEELMLRFHALGLSVSLGINPKNKINIINATGFANSNAYDDPKVCEWLNHVDMFLIDECENITESLSKIFLQKLNNLKYVYGFSASPDKIDGTKLAANTTSLFNLNESSYLVTSYVGFNLMYKKSDKKTDLHIISATFGSKRLPFRNTSMEYRLSIKNVTTHENFIRCLKFILERKREILFIPVAEVANGERIYEIVKKLGYDPILWHSGCVKSEHGLRSYAEIKKYCANNKVDVLIATVVAYLGVDLHQLSDILLVHGSNYSRVIQPIGRCFRHDHPSIWLLREMVEKKNSFYVHCYYRRLALIKKAYQYQLFNHSYDEIKNIEIPK